MWAVVAVRSRCQDRLEAIRFGTAADGLTCRSCTFLCSSANLGYANKPPVFRLWVTLQAQPWQAYQVPDMS